ncbi:metallophosphoesterase [Candidatus Woesearchaeota archaeon]|nr:metallophosphoesterase [Candidatus Woesearchaeota archaeon]
MNRIVAFALFFIFFFVVYFGMHFYVFVRLSNYLQITRNLWFYLVLFVLASGFPLASFLERTVNGQLTRMFYALSATWLGAVFLLFMSLLVYEVIRRVTATNDKIGGFVVILLVLVLLFYGIINAMLIRVNHVEVPIDGLDEPVKIVQLSDIHLGTIHNSDYMTRIVGKVNAIKPDIVMITGDFFDSSARIDAHTVAPLNSIKAKTFFSLGNHEIYEGVDDVMRIMNTTSVKTLRNEVVKYKGLQIVGVDNPDREFLKGNSTLSGMKLNRSMPTVLMFHPPQGLDDSVAAGIDLQLSGHTHNGQIFPFNLVVMAFFPRIRGLYEYNGMHLYVSPGTGTWGPPMRIGSRSEITVLNLVNKK